jgi:hypothetical protein
MRRLLLIACLLTVTLCVIASAQDAPASAEAAEAVGQAAPDYGDTYTPEELAALDQALWAGNLTRADMRFMKDYGEGYGCFPIVHEMMDDPLSIAPWMDQMAALANGMTRLSPQGIVKVMQLCHEDNFVPGVPWQDREYYQGKDTDYFPAAVPEVTVWQVKTTSDLEELLILMSSTQEYLLGYDTPEGQPKINVMDVLTQIAPAQMMWHDVIQSPYEDLDTYRKIFGRPDATAEEQQAWLTNAEEVPVEDLYKTLSSTGASFRANDTYAKLWFSHPTTWVGELPASAFPTDKPIIRDTMRGRIAIGTYGDDTYEGDFTILIDPGGNDTYHNCRLGAGSGYMFRRSGYFADMGGSDLYDCADVDMTLGAAVMGYGFFYDLGGGDDRYYAGFCSLGAAIGGVALFYDDGGCDYYSGKAFTQGAAGFGIGVMIDDSVDNAPVFDTAEGNEGVIDEHESGASDKDVHSRMDNDYYTAWESAQAFARTRGVALCINRRGNEVYHAGGVYLHAPLFADRYHSFSQGFAIGERDIDWAGGVAMLIDYEGNDRYLGDIYSQGVGYWYSAGLLWDGGGNDSYEMTQYGQGAGIHLAVGGLVDCAGNDTYVMHSGLGQGGSHDLAASILHDRGGDDRYMGATTCNGAALTGSVGIQIDRSGNDTYGGRKDSGVNHTDNRSYNIGVLVDCAGNDDYLSIQADGLTTLMRNLSMAADIAPPPVVETKEEVQPETSGYTLPGIESFEMPEVISYKGELTQEVFDELWAICCRWEVGDNRYIVPKARERLLAFGPQLLPYLEPKMNDDESLTMRGYTTILQPLYEGEGKQAVIDLLKRQAATEDETRQNNALYIAGDIKVAEMADTAAGFLDNESSLLQRRAMGVLAALGSHAGDDKLIALLASNDEVPLKSALSAAITLKIDCYPAIQPLLSHPLISVRELAIAKLAEQWETYGPALEVDIAELSARGALEGTDLRRERSLQHVLMRLATVPSAGTVAAVGNLLSAEDWGLRGDAVRTVRHWEKLAQADLEWGSADPQLVDALDTAGAWVEEMLQDEQNPYVKACGEVPVE